MISGFLSPWEPLFMDLNISKYFKQYEKTYGNILTTYVFCEICIWKHVFVERMCALLELLKCQVLFQNLTAFHILKTLKSEIVELLRS